MIVKLEDINIHEVNKYLKSKIFEFGVTIRNGTVSEIIYFDLKSDKLSFENKDNYIGFLGFSRIDNLPIFKLKDGMHIDDFTKVRIMKINSILEESEGIKINPIIQMLKNPNLLIIRPLEDNGYSH